KPVFLPPGGMDVPSTVPAESKNTKKGMPDEPPPIFAHSSLPPLNRSTSIFTEMIPASNIDAISGRCRYSSSTLHHTHQGAEKSTKTAFDSDLALVSAAASASSAVG